MLPCKPLFGANLLPCKPLFAYPGSLRQLRCTLPLCLRLLRGLAALLALFFLCAVHELLGDKVIDPIAGTLRANKVTSRQRGRGGELQQTTAVTGGPRCCARPGTLALGRGCEHAVACTDKLSRSTCGVCGGGGGARWGWGRGGGGGTSTHIYSFEWQLPCTNNVSPLPTPPLHPGTRYHTSLRAHQCTQRSTAGVVLYRSEGVGTYLPVSSLNQGGLAPAAVMCGQPNGCPSRRGVWQLVVTARRWSLLYIRGPQLDAVNCRATQRSTQAQRSKQQCSTHRLWRTVHRTRLGLSARVATIVF